MLTLSWRKRRTQERATTTSDTSLPAPEWSKHAACACLALPEDDETPRRNGFTTRPTPHQWASIALYFSSVVLFNVLHRGGGLPPLPQSSGGGGGAVRWVASHARDELSWFEGALCLVVLGCYCHVSPLPFPSGTATDVCDDGGSPSLWRGAADPQDSAPSL